VKSGDPIELELDTLGPAGEGVGPHETRAVHVPGGFPGERVAARVTHVSRQRPVAHAGLLRIITPHPGRRASPCIHHDTGEPGKRKQPLCTGCPLLSLAVEDQRTHKMISLAREHGLQVDQVVAAPAEFGYRFSSKRVVGGPPGNLVLGSYVRGTHTLAAMHACQVDHPEIVLAAEELRRVADSLAIEAHDENNEKTGTGDLRYAWFKTDGHEVLLTLVTASEDSRAARELPERLRRPVGIAWSVQPSHGNSLRGRPAQVLRGQPELALELAGVPLTTGPLGFLQPNPAVAALAYADLVRGPDGVAITGALAFDLYAGAGVTTKLLRQHFTEVRPCEAYPESAALLDVPPETTEAFLQRQTERPTLVIANPPRDGLGPQVCAELLRLAPPHLHIMSCGPASLARDLAALAPKFRVVAIRAYDTLPHTPHVELVAWLAAT